jgi:hypothetical protein
VKKIILLFIISLLSFATFAQDTTNTRAPKKEKKNDKKQRTNIIQRIEEEENDLLFNKHSIFGIKLSSDGYGLSYEKGKFNTRRRATIFQVELNEKKHPKEYKLTSGSAFFSQNELIVGKRNNFYQVKLGAGQQYLIGTKANRNGVHVSAIGVAGFSAGLQKPYIVTVEKSNAGKAFESTYPTIIDSGYVEIGAAGFTKGWGNVTFRPGAHAKTALRFDYGKYNEVIGAIEAGVNVEYYFSSIQQMAFVKEKKLFFNAYVSILFGKRK